MDTQDSIRELVDQAQSYYQAGQNDLSAKTLVQALEQGANANIKLFQSLADYIYGRHSDEAKVYKLTPQEPMEDSIESLRRMCWELMRNLRCGDHGHTPYVLAKESFLFIACCCASLERDVQRVLSESFKPVEILLDEGWTLQQRGEFKEAIRKYEQVLKIQPVKKEISMLACLNIGNIFYERKEFREAIQYYKEAAEINPSNDSPYYNLANAYRDIGKFEEAVNEYKRAIELNLHDADYHRNLGLVYAEIGELNSAAREIQKCVEISHGDDPFDYYNIGILHYMMQNYHDAITWLKRYVNEAPVSQRQYITNAERIIEKTNGK